MLEREISLEELDSAAAECKTKSAAGPDGISNGFIKKFWTLLRIPDCTAIKNWRPISLLNCIYKIVSKSINNRLKKIADTVMSWAQKGFTQSRYIQEVIINVVHNISHCNSTNTPAFVLALDQRKAFDSVRHDFMNKVYKFIGISENFSKLLNLVTTGRNASIIMDNNTLTRTFNLETGAPLGNSPSLLQYNFCEQIALIKIELDPRIASVYNHMLVPRDLMPVPAPVQAILLPGPQVPDPALLLVPELGHVPAPVLDPFPRFPEPGVMQLPALLPGMDPVLAAAQEPAP